MNYGEAGRLGAFASAASRARLNASRKASAEARFSALSKRCLHCNQPLAFEKRFNKFCAHKCRAIYWNTRRGSQARGRLCVVCGKPSKRAKHCTQTCWQVARWNAEKARLLASGVAAQPVTAKRLLTELHGRRCAVCKGDSWMGVPIPLTLDHVNGNADDNSISNLRLLCPNCHAQTPSFAGGNRGKGRLSRRLRDHEDSRTRNGWGT